MKRKFNALAEENQRYGILVPMPLAFNSVVIDPAKATEPVTVQAFRLGKWDHMLYGKVEITPLVFSDMVRNFTGNAYGQDLSINYEHGLDKSKGLQAAGWVKGMIPVGDAMMWSIQFTQDALQEIKDGKWRYFSPEYIPEYVDPETKQKYHNIAVGGALTNVPYFKGMMPLNFSELFTLKEADEILEAFSNATDGNGWESSEPGTNAPDLNAIQPDRAALEGWRRDTPPYPRPIPNDGKPYPARFNGREDSIVNREQMLAFAASIDLTVDTNWTDEQLMAKITEHGKQIYSELAPLREAADAARQTQTFAQQYPQEFARMQKLEKDNLEAAAQKFSNRYERFTEKDEEGNEKESRLGFSALALDKIKEMYVAVASGEATVEMFSGLLDTFSNKGVLEFGTRGSGLESEVEGGDNVVQLPGTRTTVPSNRQAFSNLVRKHLQENEGVSMSEAVKAVAAKHPKEFEAYQTPLVASSNTTA